MLAFDRRRCPVGCLYHGSRPSFTNPPRGGDLGPPSLPSGLNRGITCAANDVACNDPFMATTNQRHLRPNSHVFTAQIELLDQDQVPGLLCCQLAIARPQNLQIVDWRGQGGGSISRPCCSLSSCLPIGCIYSSTWVSNHSPSVARITPVRMVYRKIRPCLQVSGPQLPDLQTRPGPPRQHHPAGGRAGDRLLASGEGAREGAWRS